MYLNYDISDSFADLTFQYEIINYLKFIWIAMFMEIMLTTS